MSINLYAFMNLRGWSLHFHGSTLQPPLLIPGPPSRCHHQADICGSEWNRSADLPWNWVWKFMSPPQDEYLVILWHHQVIKEVAFSTFRKMTFPTASDILCVNLCQLVFNKLGSDFSQWLIPSASISTNHLFHPIKFSFPQASLYRHATTPHQIFQIAIGSNCNLANKWESNGV